MSLLLSFLYSQLFVTPQYPDKDFTNQTIVVTGANAGLGLEAARHFARLNADKVILAVRNLSKGEAAKKSIEESTGKKNTVEVWHLDLSSYGSVKEFAARIRTLDRLDAVVENAGIATFKYVTAEDNESTITTNVVSTFLLALLVLPKLHETGQKYKTTPRLTIVSSDVHQFTDFKERKSPRIFEKLNDKETADMSDRYNVSKLLEVLYCRELAAKMTESKKPRVTLNYLNPGLCHSEMAREGGFLLVYILKPLFARTTEVGARTLLASAAADHSTHGQYMSDCKSTLPSAFVRSPEGAETQKRVWNELNAKLEKIQPKVLENI